MFRVGPVAVACLLALTSAFAWGSPVAFAEGDYVGDYRYDPLVPHVPATQLGRDWCAVGADVEFFTNEQPPLFFPIVVDAPRALQWIADRFADLPTTPDCGRF